MWLALAIERQEPRNLTVLLFWIIARVGDIFPEMQLLTSSTFLLATEVIK